MEENMDPFKDQRALFPRIIISILNAVLEILYKVGIELTAEEIVSLEFFELEKLSQTEVEKIVKLFKDLLIELEEEDDFYTFYISKGFSLMFADKPQKKIINNLEKMWICILTDEEIREFLERIESFIPFEKWIEKRNNLIEKLKK